MTTGTTIAAIATGWATSEAAILRLSGPGVADLLRERAGVRLTPHEIIDADLRLADGTQVPCWVMTFAGPASYTGEDSAELILPGNPILLERLLADLLADDRVSEAAPGEFSARAFMAGKLTLEQAEGIAATIAARTEAQLDAARSLARNERGERVTGWADTLATALALVEAGIDFTDQEDVIPIGAGRLASRLADLRAAIAGDCAADRADTAVDRDPIVVLAGRPNAGKSTLFNALLGRRRAVTSEQPGTTRDRLAEPLDLSEWVPGALSVQLTDLAGIDHGFDDETAQGRIDAEAVEVAERAITDADVILYCDPTGRFRTSLSERAAATTIRVRTMADRGGAAGDETLAVCALDGWNLPVLRRAIADAAVAVHDSGDTNLLPRHRRALVRATHEIDAALGRLAGLGPNDPIPAPELAAGHLRDALDALSELTGRISPDDVIGRVFATFCVGK